MTTFTHDDITAFLDVPCYTTAYSVAINKRTISYKDTKRAVYDVWSMLDNGQWQSVANAMSPRLIKEFFNVDVK